ncbi:MAG TPA: acyl-CoA dehydrogenase family protein, partial [Candidatus Sulfotelmatobacter sp.]|nr:acyl-CoA dehydrogenase family protein [Candidatus Sulfotelmatobacter sp.]
MAWDFETDAEFQGVLNWVDKFVREEVEPLDHVLGLPHDVHNPNNRKLVKPLQAKVKEMGLWACHLGPELGGQGYGQLKLALLNEILGRARFAPIVFGCQAPDSGNAEILATYGTDEQKARYLRPLLDGDIVSSFSMTEPHAGSDPTMFKVRAEMSGNHWVINGEKWFSSNARFASFLVVLAVTDPEASPTRRMSMFIVPRETPGVNIIRNVNAGMEGGEEGTHGYIRYENVRIPTDHLLGERGQGFVVAQTRLGGGRIHHAMRTLGQCRVAFDMMCERALSRFTQGSKLADKQMVQDKIAESWLQLEQFRLLLLRTAWRIDRAGDYRQVRKDIAAVKVLMPRVLHDIAANALQIHGSLGLTNEVPFVDQIITAFRLGIADGPTEVHKVTLAKQVLRGYAPSPDGFPTRHAPKRASA